MTSCTEKSQSYAALTIAGSDSGGGAGIQADLRAFRCFNVFGCSAIAAVTSQNPLEVRRIDPLPPEALTAQIRAVLDVFAVRGAKTGMLFSEPLIQAAADALKGRNFPLVADPVMVSTSGMRLLREDAISAMISRILPEADWITPNIPEAELLLQTRIRNFDDMKDAACRLSEKFQCGVILKGGHADDDPRARDAVCTSGGLKILSSPRLAVLPHASHGTGCTFSSALAAAFAKGYSEEEALMLAKSFVYLSLQNARLVSPHGAKDAIGTMPPSLSGFPCISGDIQLEPL